MKKFLYSFFFLVMCSFFVSTIAGNPNSNSERVKWVSIDELDKLQEEEPRLVIIDIYADWCGWCKKMDKDTYQHPVVSEYLNEKFYAVKLDAEEQQTISFKGKEYAYIKNGRSGANELALDLLGNSIQLPATVFLTKDYRKLNAVPGYLEPIEMDKMLHYYGESYHKKRIPYGIFESKYRSKIKPSKNR